jgi:hypothetical protein
MARVPSLPSPGQPIDTSYVYGIVDSLISINNELASNGSAYIDNGVSNSASGVRTGNLVFSARTITNLNISKGNFKVGDNPSGTISFNNGSAFSRAPVVTANLQSATDTGAKFILTISAITSSGFNWNAYCIVAGAASYNINFIAIGV